MTFQEFSKLEAVNKIENLRKIFSGEIKFEDIDFFNELFPGINKC